MKILRTKPLITVVIIGFIAGFCLLFTVCRGGYKICVDFAWSVEGYVRDSISGAQIDSARIVIADASDTTLYQVLYTDSIGYYKFVTWCGRNAKAQWWITASKEGYFTQKKTVEVIQGKRVQVNFNLYPKGR